MALARFRPGGASFGAHVQTKHSPAHRYLLVRLAVLACVWGSPSRAQETDGAEVQINGQRPAQGHVAHASSVSTSEIARERLDRPGAELPDALREAPGVQVSQTGGLGAPSTARLRGATSAQTPVFLGEVRINDEVGGVADLSTVPLHIAESVQVFRSHTPRRLPHMGIGGAIVIVPKRVADASSSLGVEAGSFGARVLRGSIAVEKKNRSLLVSTELSAADNDYSFFDTRGTLFVDDDGAVMQLPNADSQTRSLWASSENRLGRADVQLLFHHAERKQGAPKLALLPTHGARAQFQRDLFSIATKTPTALGYFRSATRALLGETTIDDPLHELGMLTPRIRTPGEHIEQSLQLSQAPSDVLWLSQGLTASVERLRRFERTANQDKQELAARRNRLSGSLAAAANLPHNLTFDAQWLALCHATTTQGGALCDESSVTGRFGARIKVGISEWYANVGTGQRLPTLSELFGTSLLVRGNEALSAERATTSEVGVRLAHSGSANGYGLWLDAAGFARWTKDLVTYVRSAQGYLHPVNRASARSIGGEISVGGHIHGGIEAEASLALLDARDTSSSRTLENDVLPFLSRATAHFLATYRHRFQARSWLAEASLGLRTYYQSSRYADPAGLGVIPAQFFSDLEMSAHFSSSLKLRGRLSNLFDAERFDVVGFPLPGRSGFLSLEANW